MGINSFKRVYAFLCIMIFSAPVTAALEEVVVTAQKREQNLQDVALSISALSEDSIKTLGIEDFRQWADYVPGITMSYGLNSRRGGPLAVVRGVTNQVRGGIGDNTANATTAYTIGEIPVFSVSPSMNDLNRIEALKGPQGTLFGIAAMGGVVRYIPNHAQTDEFSASISGGAGLIEHGGGVYNTGAMVNVPIIQDVLAVRLAGHYNHNDGFIDHIFPPLSQTAFIVPTQRAFDPREDFTAGGQYEEDTNQKISMGGKIAVTYTPTDRLTIKGMTIWDETRMADAWQADVNDPLKLVRSRFVKEPQEMEFSLSSLEVAYDFDFGKVEYIGGYYENDLSETVDATKFTGDQLVDLGGLPFPTSANFPFTTNTQQWTHELRVQGQDKSLAGINLFGDEMTFDYVIGGFWQEEVRDGGYVVGNPNWNDNLPAGAPANAFIANPNGARLAATGKGSYKNKALFVDLTLRPIQKLSIGGGIRWFDQKKDQEGRGFSDEPDGMGGRVATDFNDPDFRNDGTTRWDRSTLTSDGITPRATVQYNIDDDKMVFFNAAKGQRIGATAPDNRPVSQITENWQQTCIDTIQSLGLLQAIQDGTTTDSVWSYDVGIKSTWLEDRLRFNASAYLTDWTDLQQVVIVNSVNQSCSQVIQANVGAAQIKGFEVETTYSPTNNITLNGSIAYANAEISDAPAGVLDSIGQPLEKGDAITSVPPWTANFGAQYTFDVPYLGGGYTGYIRADWRYVDERIKGFGDKASLRAAIPLNVAKSYHLTDIRMGMDNEDWSVSFYVSNLLDDVVEFEAQSNFFQPFLKEAGVNQPRTFGFNVTRRFR